MTVLRTTLTLMGLVLPSLSLQASYITAANVIGGTNVSSYARAQDGVKIGGSIENFTCAVGGTSNAGGTAPTNSFANATCEAGRETASADLATGQLRGYALTNGPSLGTQADANARFSDTVTLNNTTGGNLLLGLSYLTQGAVTGEVAGTTTVFDFSEFTLGGLGGSQNVTLQGHNYALGGGLGLRFVYQNGASSFHDPLAGGNPNLTGWATSSVAGIGALVQGTLVVPSGISVVVISADISLDNRAGANSDFSHTAAFSFGALPTGLSFTSDSGVFLTGVPAGNPAPEPGTWAMLGGGLLSAAIVRRRKSAARR